MLGDGSAVTAVLDFGVIALVGDRRLDPLAAVAYLAPNITPTANPTDRALAREWLAERGLAELYEPARRWLAAFCLACQTRRGVSALELQDRLQLGSYETAWNMTRRMLAVQNALPEAGAKASAKAGTEAGA